MTSLILLHTFYYSTQDEAIAMVATITPPERGQLLLMSQTSASRERFLRFSLVSSVCVSQANTIFRFWTYRDAPGNSVYSPMICCDLIRGGEGGRWARFFAGYEMSAILAAVVALGFFLFQRKYWGVGTLLIMYMAIG